MIPVFNEDPFLRFRPFPAEPSNALQAHWHEIVGAIVFYSLLKAACKPLLTKWLGTTYTGMARNERAHFDIHCVSIVQNIASLLLLIPMWNHPFWVNRVEDPVTSITGYYPYASLVASLTVGYFAWDVFVCLRYYSVFGAVFLFHGVAAFYLFGTSYYPFITPWVRAFLMFEASTPFVNFHWIAKNLPKGTISERAITINGLLLIAVFFSARIAWGSYAAITLTIDIWRTWGVVPWWLPVSVLGVNYLLNVLNAFWFYKMAMIAVRKIFGTKRTPREKKVH